MIADLTEIEMTETIVGMTIEENIDEIDLERETTDEMIETTDEMIIEEMIAPLGMKEMIVETLIVIVVDSISVRKIYDFQTTKTSDFFS